MQTIVNNQSVSVKRLLLTVTEHMIVEHCVIIWVAMMADMEHGSIFYILLALSIYTTSRKRATLTRQSSSANKHGETKYTREESHQPLSPSTVNTATHSTSHPATRPGLIVPNSLLPRLALLSLPLLPLPLLIPPLPLLVAHRTIKLPLLVR